MLALWHANNLKHYIGETLLDWEKIWYFSLLTEDNNILNFIYIYRTYLTLRKGYLRKQLSSPNGSLFARAQMDSQIISCILDVLGVQGSEGFLG